MVLPVIGALALGHYCTRGGQGYAKSKQFRKLELCAFDEKETHFNGVRVLRGETANRIHHSIPPAMDMTPQGRILPIPW